MLAHTFRFHRRSAIQHIHAHGSSVRGDRISIKYTPNKRDESRAAVIVSKKVDKRAVVRNRIRRRVYEVLRSNWGNIVPGNDFLVSVFDAGIADVPKNELESLLLGILNEAGLVK